MRTARLLILVGLIALAAGALWSRRTPHAQLRSVGAPPVLDIVHDATGDGVQPPVSEWASHSIEHHLGADFEYSFAVVEFDDQGIFFDKQQLANLGDYIKRIGRRDGAILVAYAHGWNHNAAVSDDNVACFQEVLRAVAKMQHANKAAAAGGPVPDPRPVVGIYFGWRGLALTPAWLNQSLTFWNRADAAERVGAGGDMLETLLALRELRNTVRPDRTKLVVVGHSLGARAVFRALQPFYAAAVMSSHPPKSPTRPPSSPAAGWNVSEPFGDLVILVNPAFSASAYRAIADRLVSDAAAPEYPVPHMVIAASEADEVTRTLYPLSQNVARWLEETQDRDRSTLFEAVGNHMPFATHKLVVAEGHVPTRPPSAVRAGVCSVVAADELSIVQGSRRVGQDVRALYDYRRISHPPGPAGTGGYTTELHDIPRRPTRAPYMLIRVDPALIPGHNEVFGSGFVDFLIRIVNRATVSPEVLASLE